MRLHRAVILVLRILIAREEMRLPERKKALAGLQWSRVQILRKHSELFYASNHAFCYALRIVLKHRYVSLCWRHKCRARCQFPCKTSSKTLLFPLHTRKRVVHAEYSRTNRCPLQEILHVVSPTPGAESHPRFINIADPDSDSPPCHCRVGKTAQTRDELSPSTLHGAMEESTVV